MKNLSIFNIHVWVGVGIISILGLLSPVVHAQSLLGGDVPFTSVDPLSIDINPTYPEPHEEVTAEAISNTYDLGNATITWTLDGRIVSGEGSRTLIFTMGNMGTRKSVGVTIRTADGAVVSEQINVYPGTVDLIWEAPSSYTPPFYAGKALPSAGSTLKLTAIPDIRSTNGSKLPTGDIVFTWTQNGRVLGNESGRGKNTLTVPGPEIYSDFEIRLDATSFDRSVGARTFLSLPPVSPQVQFYEKHPTLGVRLERVLAREAITSGEIEVVAEPFYVDTPYRGASDVRFTWNLNGASVTNPSANPANIILRPTGQGGRALVGITVEHLSKIFQQTAHSFEINFTGEASDNVFTY
jgi:hypothetical protein